MSDQRHRMAGMKNSDVMAALDMQSPDAVVGPAYLVGGSVRDALLGRECGDYDFATPLDPEHIEAAVRAAGRRAYTVGKRFGTIAFKLGGDTIEVTTFRTETYVDQTRRPDVVFVERLEDDLSRRDFTINAMAMDAERGLVDPFGGRDDLALGLIRAVGNPRERFREDPLRMLRAARFASQLEFAVDAETISAARRLAHRILWVARERWVTELDKLLVGPGVASGLRLLAEMDLLRFLLPELQLQVGYDQRSPYHDRELFEHTLGVVVATPPDVTLRWAALLHDVGKPYVRVDKDDRSTYVRHDLIGAEIVERIGLYLKWGNRRREEVSQLVRDHMREDSPLRAADDSAKAGRPQDAGGS